MPHFFFDASDGTSYQRDEDGHVIANLELARDLALECLPYMARNKLNRNGGRQSFTVDVRDESGRVVYTACLSLLAPTYT